jgi:hypothetical protein
LIQFGLIALNQTKKEKKHETGILKIIAGMFPFDNLPVCCDQRFF